MKDDDYTSPEYYTYKRKRPSRPCIETVKFSPEEHDKIRTLARVKELTVPEYLRYIALKEPAELRLNQEEVNLLKQLAQVSKTLRGLMPDDENKESV